MKLYREIALRKQADDATIAMLDLWRSLCEKRFGIPLEVMIGNRKEHKQLKDFPGEVYTAYPHNVEGRMVLCLWLDRMTNVNSILVTHELGHWVIKLQGFKGLIFKPDVHCDQEIYLNSLCSHPPLYALQRKLGHEPQIEIDSRAKNNLMFVDKSRPKYSETQAKKISLLLTDDLLNCTSSIARLIRSKARRFHPEMYKLIQIIMSSIDKFNLMNPEENLRCQSDIVQNLSWSEGWIVSEDVKNLASKIVPSESDKT